MEYNDLLDHNLYWFWAVPPIINTLAFQVFLMIGVVTIVKVYSHDSFIKLKNGYTTMLENMIKKRVERRSI